MRRIVLLLLSIFLLSGCTNVSNDEKLKEQYVKNDLSFHYAQKQCNKKEKIIYDQIYLALMQQKKTLRCEITKNIDFVSLYTNVLDDHPNIYWAGDFTYRDEKYNKKIIRSITFHYTKTKKQRKQLDQQLKQVSNKIINGIASDASDYDKVKYLYDYIIDHTVYDKQSKDNQTILSVFMKGKSVCAGYAKSIQYLCNQMNIDCHYMPGASKVSGFASENNGAHAWNMVKMDGNYYYLDATFGDDEENDFRYAYFAISSKEMLELYQPNYEYEESMAIDDNYFVKQDAYFDSYNEVKMTRLLAEAKLKGEHTIMFKCSDEAIAYQLKQILIDDYRFFELAKQQGIDLETIHYVAIPNVNVLVFII
ncbi:MAG: transglutaminase domain-containing protein [Erysipelotrichaceae bacterium]